MKNSNLSLMNHILRIEKLMYIHNLQTQQPKWTYIKNVLNTYMHFALTSIIFILLSNITIATGFADNVAFNESISFSNTGEGSTSGIKNTDGEQTHQPYLADITRFIAIPAWTNHFITKALDMPILTVPQPAGIVLIGSATFGLLIRFLRRRYRKLRPLVDYGISFTGLLIASPIFLVVGIITKITSRGSMFYTQERVGKDNRLFNMIKFRTMHVGAESQTGPVWSKKNDSRITGFGRFLRNTHLDELPQLINVLKGEMSIIGPRPERPFFVNKFKDEIHGYTRRLSIKPGITGLAQCYYKYDETIQDVRKKLIYDVLYIKRMCWMLDLRILLKTLSVSILGGRTH